MATFRVGQRVRVIRTYGGGLLGREGTIIDLNVIVNDDERGGYVGHELDLVNKWGWTCVARPEDIEPIQDRPELSSWEALQALGLDVESVKGEEAKGRALKDLGLDVDRVRKITEVA
jgi:hypothetical protein